MQLAKSSEFAFIASQFRGVTINICSGPNDRQCVYISFAAEQLVRSQFLALFLLPAMTENNTVRTLRMNQNDER